MSSGKKKVGKNWGSMQGAIIPLLEQYVKRKRDFSDFWPAADPARS